MALALSGALGLQTSWTHLLERAAYRTPSNMGENLSADRISGFCKRQARFGRRKKEKEKEKLNPRHFL
ncbi:hypothetical protein HI914_03253 [Erysiphe necator]|nr:hypothetical protein HI914_03253 [Erysiphe necator]